MYAWIQPNAAARTYSTSVQSSTEDSAPKSMPTPGVRGMALSMSALVFSPAARSPAITASLETPAGSSLETTPAKIRLVPSPSSRGPMTFRATLTTANIRTRASQTRSGCRVPSRRLAEAPKLDAFSAGTFMPANGPPLPGPIGGRCGPRTAVLMPPPPLRVGRPRFPGTFRKSPTTHRAFPAQRSCRRRALVSGQHPRCWTRAGR